MQQAGNIEKHQGGTSSAEDASQQKSHYIRLISGGILWVIAIVAMVMLSLFAHSHFQPVPFELTTSKDIQALSIPSAIQAIMRWFTAINDPIPDTITVIIMVAILAILRKFKAAIFLALCAGIGDAADAVIGDLVQRPRPSPHLIHVDSLLKFNSFPSGHSCHMMVFYGFLLFLSFTRPVRQWKYRGALIPLQIYAIITILIMGFARIWEGEHWITDVAGGYVDGLIWMLLFIFLYSWTTRKLEERRARKAGKQALGQAVS
ncbi:MAG: phosphatase PAP2 family protein [Ktedonobacteraceae bacterium]|nr:phosphatase PAP2 family protein [Ktedonobacteraceae bacterium]